MLGRQAEDAEDEVREQVDAPAEQAGETDAGPERADAPVMPPPPPFPSFQSTPTLPHQVPGVGFESGRDSRAR